MRGEELGAALILGVFIGALMTATVLITVEHELAIENKCAYYDSQTGDFVWGAPKESSDE